MESERDVGAPFWRRRKSCKRHACVEQRRGGEYRREEAGGTCVHIVRVLYARTKTQYSAPKQSWKRSWKRGSGPPQVSPVPAHKTRVMRQRN